MRTEIGVSKLCCPVCSVLLSVLKSQGDQTIPEPFIPGFHSIMSTVELPPWLSDDVIDTMLHSFSQKLCMELKLFTSGTSMLSLQCNTLLMSDNAVNQLIFFSRVRPLERWKTGSELLVPYAQRK